jgi:hypothetical protein
VVGSWLRVGQYRHAGLDEDDQPDPEHAGLAEQVREPAAQRNKLNAREPVGVKI